MSVRPMRPPAPATISRMSDMVLLPLERDDFSSNRHPALAFWWSMIFFRKPVPTCRDHALNVPRIWRGSRLRAVVALDDEEIELALAPTQRRRGLVVGRAVAGERGLEAREFEHDGAPP